MRQCATDIAHQTPGIHLPRRPHALSKKEITGQRCQRADHEAVASAQRRPRDNSDGAHGFKVGNGAEQDAANAARTSVGTIWRKPGRDAS